MINESVNVASDITKLLMDDFITLVDQTKAINRAPSHSVNFTKDQIKLLAKVAHNESLLDSKDEVSEISDKEEPADPKRDIYVSVTKKFQKAKPK